VKAAENTGGVAKAGLEMDLTIQVENLTII